MHFYYRLSAWIQGFDSKIEKAATFLYIETVQMTIIITTMLRKLTKLGLM